MYYYVSCLKEFHEFQSRGEEWLNMLNSLPWFSYFLSHQALSVYSPRLLLFYFFPKQDHVPHFAEFSLLFLITKPTTCELNLASIIFSLCALFCGWSSATCYEHVGKIPKSVVKERTDAFDCFFCNLFFSQLQKIPSDKNSRCSKGAIFAGGGSYNQMKIPFTFNVQQKWNTLKIKLNWKRNVLVAQSHSRWNETRGVGFPLHLKRLYTLLVNRILRRPVFRWWVPSFLQFMQQFCCSSNGQRFVSKFFIMAILDTKRFYNVFRFEEMR